MGKVYSMQRMRENLIAVEIIREIRTNYKRLKIEGIPAGHELLHQPQLKHLVEYDCLIIFYPAESGRGPGVVPRYEWKIFLEKLKPEVGEAMHHKKISLMTLLMYKSLSQVLEHIFLK